VRGVILLFAKAPTAGQVKTRLEPLLGPQAAALYKCFVRDLAELAGSVSNSDFELCTNVPTSAWPDITAPRRLQSGPDLGSRILNAMEEGLGAGRPWVTVLGSDSPDLPAAHFDQLLASDADVTLGPAPDGGYWGIVCRKTHPEMFNGVDWSTSRALGQTVAACAACGLTTALGPEWYDVDRPEDFARLFTSTTLGRHTARWLASYLSNLRDN
jgi:rSAM/selenodomain-associated transferase 1